MRYDIAIDLGTQTVRTASGPDGTLFEAAAVLAFREGVSSPLFGGDAAQQLIGRIGEDMYLARPIRDGVLENSYAAGRMIRWLYRQAGTLPRRHFTALLGCSPFARPVQVEAMADAALEAGAASVCVVRSDAAAALGAGMELNAPEAKLIVDIGAGKMTASLFTLGRIASFRWLPYGLGRIDQRIVRALKEDHGYRVGERASEEIKHTLGSALPGGAPEDVVMHMTGFSMADRLPLAFDVETKTVVAACEDVVRELAGMCSSAIANVPEELSADLNDTGAVLAGSGAEMTGMSKRIGDAIGIPCRLADAPGTCVIRGLWKMAQDMDAYRPAILLEKNSQLLR